MHFAIYMFYVHTYVYMYMYMRYSYVYMYIHLHTFSSHDSHRKVEEVTAVQVVVAVVVCRQLKNSHSKSSHYLP